MQKRTTVEKALLRKYPEGVVLVSAAWKGKLNAMAAGWVMMASDEPWMFALGIDDASCTLAMIRRSREFVVAFPTENQARETLFMGTHHGHELDKFNECKLKIEQAVHVKAPLIAEAVANFECKLTKIIKPGNCPLVFGRIVAAHVNKNSFFKRLYTVGKGYCMSGVCAKSAEK